MTLDLDGVETLNGDAHPRRLREAVRGEVLALQDPGDERTSSGLRYLEVLQILAEQRHDDVVVVLLLRRPVDDGNVRAVAALVQRPQHFRLCRYQEWSTVVFARDPPQS